jgi:DnaJ-class molecular chaperone
MDAAIFSRRIWLEGNGYTPVVCNTCNGWGVESIFELGDDLYTDVVCKVCNGTGLNLKLTSTKLEGFLPLSKTLNHSRTLVGSHGACNTDELMLSLKLDGDE